MAIRSVVIGQSWVSLVFLFDSLVRWAAVAGDVIAGTLDSHSGGLDIWVTSFSDSSFNDSTPVADSVWTDAFSRGVDALRKAGGGVLRVPAGTYHTGPFNLTSNMVLWLAADANLVALTDRALLPVLPALPSYGPAWGKPGLPLEAPAQADFRDAIPRYQALIYGTGLTNVTITGENGTIDGKGAVWWERWLSQPLLARPHLIQFEKSREIRIHNVTLRDPGFWSVHLWRCEFVHVHFLTILVPYNGNVRPTNTDGVNPDSSSHILIEDSYLQTGDDAIAIKSGWDCWGRKENVPSTNITVRRVTVRMTHLNNAAGVAVGSEMSGGILNVTVENCHFIHVGVAVEVKVVLARGGYVRNVVARDLVVEHTNRAALEVMASYPEKSPFCDELDPPVPLIDGVMFSNVKVLGPTKGKLVTLRGAPRVRLRGIFVRGVVDHGHVGKWVCSHVSGVAEQNTPPACERLFGNSWRNDGRCGPKFKTSLGEVFTCPTPRQFIVESRSEAHAEAEPWLVVAPCCSPTGWCGNGSEHCCPTCVDSRQSESATLGFANFGVDGTRADRQGVDAVNSRDLPIAFGRVGVVATNDSYYLVDGGVDRSCRGMNRSDVGKGYYLATVPDPPVLENCKKLCTDTGRLCAAIGITQRGVCHLWTRPVRSSVASKGFACLAKLATVRPSAEAEWFNALPVNGGPNSIAEPSVEQTLGFASPQLFALVSISVGFAVRWMLGLHSRSRKDLAILASIFLLVVVLNCVWFMQIGRILFEVADSEAIEQQTVAKSARIGRPPL
eukprot:TRINITY_DN14171_c0_g1_i2.p1 TRINITY_DN14171_c0_g1~~TRINITY_DN14171_c0_g1_i2.p1  ORF type:complete len:782 (+),score=85.12 TRINITY_DN14171_c0_g1_i2:126-2471(+)